MKLVFFLANLKGGGVQRSVVNLARSATASGVDVEVVVLSSLSDNHLNVSGLNLKCLSHPRIRSNLLSCYRVMSSLNCNDIVVCGQPHVNFLILVMATILRRQTRVFITEHNPVDIAVGVKEKLIRLFKWRMYKKAAGIIAVGKAIESQIVAKLGSEGPPTRTIYNPVEPPSPDPITRTESDLRNSENSEIRFCCVGRLHPQKNFELAIRAVAIYQRISGPAFLQVIGDGELRKPLEALANQLLSPNSFEFTGFRPDAVDLMQRNDCLIVSSQWEGFGLVVIEALYMGLKVVSTKCGGPSEILGGGKYGSLCGSSAEQLHKAIEVELAIDRPHMEQYHRAYELCGPDKVLAQYLDFVGYQ